MTRFVLDTDVIIALEQVGSGLAARGELPVIVTDVVWDELEAPGDDRARAQNFARAIAGKVTVLQADSPEAATLVALQEAPRIEGAGEHSVIACCHHHPESVAVLQDKAALRRAVEELVERGYVTWAEARTMSTKYRRQFNHARVPIWWVEG